MRKYEYLIIGGGMTADSAVKGIRKVDQKGRIALISMEDYPPYDRPPLTKALWRGDKKVEEIWRSTSDFNVDLYLSQTAQKIDPTKKQVIADKDQIYQYDKLLLATGGSPRHIPNDVSEIIYYRTFSDYKKLIDLVKMHQNFGVIGGGFIGSEIAAALAMKNKNVTMIFPEAGISGAVFPEKISLFLNSYFTEKGITIRTRELVTSMEKVDEKIKIQTNKNQTLDFDCLIAGIGITPTVTLAKDAGLEVENGIIVDKYLRTSNHDIFAAGDVANFENPHLEKRIRVEHEDNANTMGEISGRNMAGETNVYNYLPYFYSDLFDLGYEAVGEINSKLDIVIDWKEEFRKGVIYYLSQNKIRGVLLWNVWNQINAARNLIASKESFNPQNVIGLLPKKD